MFPSSLYFFLPTPTPSAAAACDGLSLSMSYKRYSMDKPWPRVCCCYYHFMNGKFNKIKLGECKMDLEFGKKWHSTRDLQKGKVLYYTCSQCKKGRTRRDIIVLRQQIWKWFPRMLYSYLFIQWTHVLAGGDQSAKTRIRTWRHNHSVDEWRLLCIYSPSTLFTGSEEDHVPLGKEISLKTFPNKALKPPPLFGWLVLGSCAEHVTSTFFVVPEERMP